LIQLGVYTLSTTNYAVDAATGTVSAIGLGVDDLDASTTFYKALGYSKIGPTDKFSGWDENIMATTSGGGPSIVVMKWKDTPTEPYRPTKNLPVMLTFKSADPKVR
jgi:hypothetical protein